MACGCAGRAAPPSPSASSRCWRCCGSSVAVRGREPLSSHDARVREEVRHEIKTLQRDLGITTVHVTHDREEAMVMADRIAILDAGRLPPLGTPEGGYTRPTSPFVASFMGAGNTIKLPAEPNGQAVRIPEGPHNSAATIDASTVD